MAKRGRPPKGTQGSSKQVHNNFVDNLPHNMEVLGEAQREHPEYIRLVWRKLTEQALLGDVSAMKEFMDRVVGKPLPGTLLGAGKFSLPAIETYDDIVNACNAVIGAMSNGTITIHDGLQLSKVINLILVVLNMKSERGSNQRAEEMAESLVRFVELARERTMGNAPGFGK